MSNKAWDLVSYAQSETASREDRRKKEALIDSAWELANEVAKTYLELNCSGYGTNCGKDCPVWACPHQLVPNLNE